MDSGYRELLPAPWRDGIYTLRVLETSRGKLVGAGKSGGENENETYIY